jgi:transposase-like protein
MSDNGLNLSNLSHLFTNEDAARNFLESKLWPNGPVCPHCDSAGAYKIVPKPGSKTRKGLYCCKACRKQFTVKVGTIFEDSHIPLRKWLMVLHLMTSSKKGISSLQISREVGITVKSAWFMTHRIREAMRPDGPPDPFLNGTVEIDETYVGGRPRRGTGAHKRGRGTAKTPVMALVERDGRVRSMPIDNVTSATLIGEAKQHVSPNAVVMTDELHAYHQLGETFARHETVKHVNFHFRLSHFFHFDWPLESGSLFMWPRRVW